MYRDVFIKEFSILGCELLSYLDNSADDRCNNLDVLSRAVLNAFNSNDLFTPTMQHVALKTIALNFLTESHLSRWTLPYESNIEQSDLSVLIVMAGNLPLVGFHDLLSVVASGKKAIVKLSSKDKYLLPALIQMLSNINLYWNSRIVFTESIEVIPNMLIATGGDQTAAFFKKKFDKIPNLTRGSKTSVALLTGDESNREIEALGRDMFLYFGMGCRSVSTLLLPVGYNINKLSLRLYPLSQLIEGSQSFASAYSYQKAISSMKREWFYDGNYFLFKENTSFPPPISVIGIVHYSSLNDIERFLKSNEELLQCVVNYKWKGEFINFGEAQSPTIDTYADGLNSLEFLVKNN